jgi:hypothetical protein
MVVYRYLKIESGACQVGMVVSAFTCVSSRFLADGDLEIFTFHASRMAHTPWSPPPRARPYGNINMQGKTRPVYSSAELKVCDILCGVA